MNLPLHAVSQHRGLAAWRTVFGQPPQQFRPNKFKFSSFEACHENRVYLRDRHGSCGVGFNGERKWWEKEKNCDGTIVGMRRPCSGHIDQFYVNDKLVKQVSTCTDEKTETRQSSDGHNRKYNAITITGQPEEHIAMLGQVNCGMAFYLAFGQCETCSCKDGLVKYEARLSWMPC